MTNSQISIFDDDNEMSVSGNQLRVVKMDFIGPEETNWEELFNGFDEIHAITYTSGIGFINNLISKFAEAEIIIGCEQKMSFSLEEIFAYQSEVLETLRKETAKSSEIIKAKIDEGTLRLYVANKRISHEKIYCLSTKDGLKKRVIFGSANMSLAAFSGIQRENISYCDGDGAYDYYLSVFEDLKEDSTDEITKKAYEIANIDENIDSLPISETVKAKKVYLVERETDQNNQVDFQLRVSRTVEKIKALMPKEEKKKGKKQLFVTPERIQRIKKRIVENNKREEDLRSECPKLVIDIDSQNAKLNDTVLDLNPPKEDVKNDVDLFLKYMDGYSQFHGDVDSMKNRYFEFANWFFCSPFMAGMRDMAARYDQNKLPYPVFGLLYGKSKAGKTSFLETLLKMMIGQKPKMSAPEFTRKTIAALKSEACGAPIIVDDLTNTRFNQHAIETIKDDDYGVANHLTHYPAVVISANEDVKAVSPEIIRRTVICRVEAGLTNTEVMKSSIVRQVQHNVGTAFYREYLKRMLENLPELIDQIKDDDIDNAPDILKLSSEILVEIISENVKDVTDYVRELSLENYFSEHVTGKYVITTIKKAWKISKDNFTISEKTNELRYSAGNNFDADRIMKELPENLEAHKTRDVIVMNLEEARLFFEEPFKIPWYKKIFSN